MRNAAGLLLLLTLTGPRAFALEPDLIIDQQALHDYWYVEVRYFSPDHCALVEGCVDAPGVRKLLRFRTKTANIGRADLLLGDPTGNPLFVYSPCHGHYHFQQYADYRLKDLSGNVVAPGHKQAFCLEDTIAYLTEGWVSPTPRFTCAYQGIQAGWSDVYGAVLDCQWIDITDVPAGTYVLENEINPAHVIVEGDYTNNLASIQVQITETPGIVHRPDGAIVPGAPMQVGRELGQERIVYDVATCPAENYNLLFSTNPVKNYTYTGAVCALGTSGSALVTLPVPPPGTLLWWTVVGVEPTTLPGTEGGHGYASSGLPRPLSGAGYCGVTSTVAAINCPN